MEQQHPAPFVIASLIRGFGDHTLFQFTLATVVVGALVIFVTAFVLGLWCGWMWQRRS